MKNLIIMFGAPGSGKGIIGDKLVKAFGLTKISTGDMLRDEVKHQTPLGLKVAANVTGGTLLEDAIVDAMLFPVLKNVAGDVLLDGYPRRLSQFETLKHFAEGRYYVCSICLVISTEEILARIGQRRVCASCGKTHLAKDVVCSDCGGQLVLRPDDAIISRRIDEYARETEPVISPGLVEWSDGFLRVNSENLNFAGQTVLSFVKRHL